MMAPAAFPAFFFTLAAFILLLLTTLSVPIIKTIYLLSITGPGASGNVRLGVFGACYEGGNAEKINKGVVAHEPLGSSALPILACRCSPVTVGYNLDSRFFGQTSNTGTIVVKALAGALVLNPIAAGLAAISLLFAFFAWCASSRIMEIITFITLFLASLAAYIAFALDLAIALVARKRVEDYTNDLFDARLGNAIWLTLVGAILLTLAICASGCGAFGRYSEKNRRLNESPGMTVVSEKPGRRWPGSVHTGVHTETPGKKDRKEYEEEEEYDVERVNGSAPVRKRNIPL